MAALHDLYAKNVLYEALDAVRKSEMKKPIAPLDEQFIDVYCEPLPDAPPPEQVPHLGMLRRMTERRCMLEPFSSSPGSDAIEGDLRKQFNLHHRLCKDLKDEKLPKPLLWVLSLGRPEDLCKTDLSEFLGCLLDAHFRAAGSVPIGCNCSVYWRFWGGGNSSTPRPLVSAVKESAALLKRAKAARPTPPRHRASPRAPLLYRLRIVLWTFANRLPSDPYSGA